MQLRPYLKQEDPKMTGAPMIILYGTEETYGEGTSVPAFKQLLLEKAKFEVATVPYPGTYHAFNLNAPPEDRWDPVAIGTSPIRPGAPRPPTTRGSRSWNFCAKP